MKRFLRCSLAVLAFAFACSLSVSAQLPQWQDMHKVKKGETVFGIAKEYNIPLLKFERSVNEPAFLHPDIEEQAAAARLLVDFIDNCYGE